MKKRKVEVVQVEFVKQELGPRSRDQTESLGLSRIL